jgi:hypothetical protein
VIPITINQIRAHQPCSNGWEKLLRHLGKSAADDEPFPLLTVLESNGLDDALWCLRCLPEHERQWRNLACDYAQRVAHLNPDPRVQAAIDTARLFADGQATETELAAARTAARTAAWTAVREAAWTAAWAAAHAAAWTAACAAACAATRAAAWSTADATADAAERDWQTTRLRQYLELGKVPEEAKYESI